MMITKGVVGCVMVTLAGCGVSEARYDAALRTAADARTETQRCNDDAHAARVQLEAALAQSKDESAHLRAQADGATVENAELRRQLEKLGKDADKLLSDEGTLSSALADARSRLEELRRAQAAAEARAALFRDLALKLHHMVDAGELAVTVRDGRMVIQLPNDVLFDSGMTNLKPDGQKALKGVAAVLRTIPNRHFQVAGHADNVPIHGYRFPTNWELSNGRAVEVVHFLISQGMSPESLSAAGYGEFDPVAGNDTLEGRARNRRIEIVVQPNIDELVTVPER